MKYFATLILMLFSSNLFAQVLLVPTPDRDFNSYSESCQKQGYLCTTTFFSEQLKEKETLQFDLLLEDLDYSSKEFCSELPNRILKILKTEMISLEQVEVILKLIEQAKNFSSLQQTKSLHVIETQLQEDLATIKKATLIPLPAAFIMIFKKPIPSNLASQFKNRFIKYKIETINFALAPSSSENLVLSYCKDEKIHPAISDIKWQIDSESSCGITSQFSKFSESSSNFIKENRTVLIIGSAIAIGATILFNKYDIQLSF